MKLKFKWSNAMMVLGLSFIVSQCKKDEELVAVSQPPFQVGQVVKPGTPLGGIIKGTLLADSTYTVNDNICVAEGDTLLIQPGVHINFPGTAPYCIVVKGTLLALGTQDKQIYFTVPSVKKTDTYGADPTADPAYKGYWGGIYGETKFKSIIIKWTHIELGAGKLGTSPVSYIANGATSYAISTGNPDGILVLEDSWIYGSLDDPIRPFGCRFNMMRNTFEKCGFTGGEAMNIKSGTTGIFAYNMVIGMATNGPKASNNGGKNPQTYVQFYNNTIVNCGYRRSAAGRGGSTNFEEGSRGECYNNLMVNCKYGPRIVGATANYNGNALVVADTSNIHYGYNYNYVDSIKIANEIYPTGFATKPSPFDIPTPSTFLPANYKPGDVYDGTAVIGKNNPLFVNYPLPHPSNYKLGDISFVGNFNFRLQSTSPAIGKGYTGFAPLNVVPVDPKFGASEITPPNKDMGAYPSDGKGNKH